MTVVCFCILTERHTDLSQIMSTVYNCQIIPCRPVAQYKHHHYNKTDDASDNG